MCGKYSGDVEGGVASLIGGVVVMRKSSRSLYRPRRPVTAMGAELDNRRTPWYGVASPPNPGTWFRKTALWPFPGIVNVPVNPVDEPSSRLASTLTVTASEDVFATAMPD